jgi:ComF family protein
MVVRRKARIVFSSASDPAAFLPKLFREISGCLFSVLMPAACSLCGEELAEAALTGICASCWARLRPWRGPACHLCGLPFVSARTQDAAAALCASCRCGEYHFDRARSFGLYVDALRAVILQLKFQRRERLGKRLGELLSGVWEEIEEGGGGGPTALVPVPLHVSRQRERGFNQAELLAQGLSASLAKTRGGPAPQVDARSLRRIRPTPPQTGLSVSARHENVRGVFSVVRPERIRDKRIVLVDDVMTTGATLSACAQVLKTAGAQSVHALTLARATPEFPDTATARAGAVVDDSGSARS